MRNKFLKGLSVAFAAAMAFTVVAPALTTEAASSKAYVVTEKKYGVNSGRANGDVTKYTYDSRGRVVKEVTTSTDGSGTSWNGTATAGTPSTVETTVRVDGVVQSYTNVTATSFDYEIAKDVIDTKAVTTTTYTYYNSGAKKDQKKSATTTIEVKTTKAHTSTQEGQSYAYAKGYVATSETAYTYDSKGNKTQEVTTTKGCGLANLPNAYTPNYYYASIMTVAGDNTVEGSQAWIDAQNADDNMKDYYIVEKKQVFTNNSAGQAVSVAQTYTAGSHNYAQATDSATDTVLVGEGVAQFTYNKNGFPTKYVETNYNKVVSSVIDGATTTLDFTDTVKTFKYTYGKYLQLSKKTVTEKSPVKFVQLNYVKANGTAYTAAELAAMNVTSGTKTLAVSGTIATTVVGKDNYAKNDGSFDSYALATNYIYDDDSTTTTTYMPEVKEGTTVKTSEIAKVGSTDSFKNWDYTVKKISVPSSRATGVMKDQFLAQTDFDF